MSTSDESFPGLLELGPEWFSRCLTTHEEPSGLGVLPTDMGETKEVKRFRLALPVRLTPPRPPLPPPGVTSLLLKAVRPQVGQQFEHRLIDHLRLESSGLGVPGGGDGSVRQVAHI